MCPPSSENHTSVVCVAILDCLCRQCYWLPNGGLLEQVQQEQSIWWWGPFNFSLFFDQDVFFYYFIVELSWLPRRAHHLCAMGDRAGKGATRAKAFIVGMGEDSKKTFRMVFCHVLLPIHNIHSWSLFFCSSSSLKTCWKRMCDVNHNMDESGGMYVIRNRIVSLYATSYE